MSSSDGVVSEQICYIPCKFCNIVLAVIVPCNNMIDIVTVRCEHCSNLWSVNMAAPSESMPVQDVQVPKHRSPQNRSESGSSSKCKNKLPTTAPTVTKERVVNRPPEKRHRAPSLYNQFIKEEIQRIKVNNPDISHREAFSTAAKNWARFPNIHFGLMLETTNNSTKLDDVSAFIFVESCRSHMLTQYVCFLSYMSTPLILKL
ncbi:YABBY domain-containing protein [Cephalotus follicularis]|uniref:YABBY domain-containing protein n=1 Tax=Cephalotus follicularis TaxID=3775 RepID=A0A1Q3AYC0_CEPFO|nr:YABBY domain-containing protein [Cephalotus follicularis]